MNVNFSLKAVLSLASLAAGQLVVYPNGAVAPFDPNNAAATKVRNSLLNVVIPENHCQNVKLKVYLNKIGIGNRGY